MSPPELRAAWERSESSKGMWWDGHLQARPCLVQQFLQDFFPALIALLKAWMDEMDFTAPNPLISSILSSISQTTEVIYTVIALSGGHSHNFMLEENVLFISPRLPPIYAEIHWSQDRETLNMQRNVIAEIQPALLEINPGSLAEAVQGEICSK